MKKKNQTKRSGVRATSYSRTMDATREIGGIPVKLALQERTSKPVGTSWWVLSWRTRYSPNGKNRRFYFTEDGIWTIPAAIALEMIKELESRGALDKKYLDNRHAGFACNTLVSTRIIPAERKRELANFTGPDENWGSDPFFVVNLDPNDDWKKVMVVNTDTAPRLFGRLQKTPATRLRRC